MYMGSAGEVRVWLDHPLTARSSEGLFCKKSWLIPRNVTLKSEERVKRSEDRETAALASLGVRD